MGPCGTRRSEKQPCMSHGCSLVRRFAWAARPAPPCPCLLGLVPVCLSSAPRLSSHIPPLSLPVPCLLLGFSLPLPCLLLASCLPPPGLFLASCLPWAPVHLTARPDYFIPQPCPRPLALPPAPPRAPACLQEDLAGDGAGCAADVCCASVVPRGVRAVGTRVARRFHRRQRRRQRCGLRRWRWQLWR
eukprot:48260-Chlamydomonas_euryale.AAC.2